MPAFFQKKSNRTQFFKQCIVVILFFSFLSCRICAAVQTDSTSEVVGFLLNGNKPWEVLRINDLDTIVLPSKQRLMPLLRLLKALDIVIVSKDDIISFTGLNSAKILLNTTKKEIEKNGEKMPTMLFTGISDITSEEEIYLLPSILAEILAMKIEWDEQKYQYTASTDQKLAIWKVAPGVSPLSIKTTEVNSVLPELLGPGHPPRFSLDFIEFQLRPYFNMSQAGSATSQTIAIDSPRETFWGSAFGGRYKFQLSQTYASWNTVSGFQKSSNTQFMLNTASWTYPFPKTDITAGDTSFGLNDLVFPLIRMTGLRFSGLKGVPIKESTWSTSPGISNTFFTTEVFEGVAPAGSKVELVINSRSIEKQDVSVGTYKFEEVNLTPGILNVVRIIITDPSGFQKIIERSIFGKSINLPKGGLAYLGGIGTNRQIDNWSLHGYFGGGRVVYGLTKSLTIGTTGAREQSFYLPVETQFLLPGNRKYPDSSIHWGGQAEWIPLQHLVLEGDASISRGKGADQFGFNGFAYKVQGNLYPSQTVQLRSQYFHYSPGFFNGENAQLQNREGYAVNGRWNINRKWAITSTAVAAWSLAPEVQYPENYNNIPEEGGSLYVDFKSLDIMSKAIPWSTITLGAERIAANWEGSGAKLLYTLNIQASPSPDIFFQGFFSKGEQLDPANHSEFFSGIRIPGFTTYSPPKIDATLRVTVMPSTRIGASYYENPQRKRGTFLYSFLPQGNRFQFLTEAGYDLRYQKPVVISRTDLALDRAKRKHIALDLRYEQGLMSAFISFDFKDLFGLSRGEAMHIKNSSISPDRSGVQGRVFIDANANGKMDPGEPGLEGIQVVMDDTFRVTTDKNGYFILDAIGQNKRSRISLNINTVPATYSPTHAAQTAFLGPVGLTEINLGVTPLHSITGIVQILTSDKKTQPIQGALIQLISMNDGKKITDSITARDGSYWLGDVRPGKYYIELDRKTILSNYSFETMKKPIEVAPKIEQQELKMAPFECVVLKEEPKDELPTQSPHGLKK
jgi:hypothetical protein